MLKQTSTLFLKSVLILIACLALGGLIAFPQFEGRNANSDPVSLYFNDPFLAYVYLTAVPFFIAIYQAFKLLGYIEKNKAFSQISVRALRNIKYCVFAFMGFVTAGMPYIAVLAQNDDAPGLVGLGLVLIFSSLVIATAAGVFQKLLQNAVDIKSENDLTV